MVQLLTARESLDAIKSEAFASRGKHPVHGKSAPLFLDFFGVLNIFESVFQTVGVGRNEGSTDASAHAGQMNLRRTEMEEWCIRH